MVKKREGKEYLIKLPDNYWEFIMTHMEADLLIRSRSDAVLSLLRKAYPELKEKT